MKRVILVFACDELLAEIQGLCIWAASEFEIAAIMRDGVSAYRELKQKQYDLVISEIQITGMDGLELLRRTKSEGLCRHFVLCSKTLNYNDARMGMLLGAYDYLVSPFDNSLFFALFSRIINKQYSDMAAGIYYSDEILTFFKNRDEGFSQYVGMILDKIYDKVGDILLADSQAKLLMNTVVEKLFSEYEWLGLYLEPADFETLDRIYEENWLSYKMHYVNKAYKLFKEFCQFLPDVNNETIREILLYILNNPEGDLKQKTLALKFHMSSSYLSTVFMAHTQVLFAEYLSEIKLKRTFWLLRNTNLKIGEIAKRLGYKDIGYFVRLFKQKYGVTPSECRLSDTYVCRE